MIRTFGNRETEKIFYQQFSLKYPLEIQKVALRKLMLIDNADGINDLRVPPANHLEKLKGKRIGQYSIRINRQYRICFFGECYELF
ncbi:type II toxin-antitoxin system RelE/ParE family toxin [Limosilactobacillus viscerum]|nr:type II toxin-antitoxin system RelE/ParE family toxin [Limosilactobacillus viscerum]